ncbi:MAG: gchK [Planctomycetaceae bacterium]|nr:gchK [Planctomycetaceae bacterium]
MDSEKLFARYLELQTYVGWVDDDAHRIQAVAASLVPYLPALIEDFYNEIKRHPTALKVITGGEPQIERLKQSLIGWLHELLYGPYDRDYVLRRWRVGRRHVEIGLDQIYTNLALSRLRSGLVGAVGQAWQGDQLGLVATIQSLNRLLDLDLAKIEDAYQTEYLARQQRDERLAAIGQVAGGIAHELRNPLNVIKTSAYYLLNARNPTREKTTEHLGRIGHHVSVADGVITTLSNFAKMPLPELNSFSVELCIKEAMELNPLPCNIPETVEFPYGPLTAKGDIEHIRIVFATLIRNARDAMPQGGRLSICGRQLEKLVEVSVTDTGSGIAPENLSRLMEPLYSTKARGLGLGLALAKAILDKNKGGLTIASELGRGSIFTVWLIGNAGQENPA